MDVSLSRRTGLLADISGYFLRHTAYPDAVSERRALPASTLAT
jgi:hypothetical protein